MNQAFIYAHPSVNYDKALVSRTSGDVWRTKILKWYSLIPKGTPLGRISGLKIYH